MIDRVLAWLGFAPIVALARICEIKRRQVAILGILTAIGAVFDALGLAMLYPIGQALLAGGDVEALKTSSQVWKYLDIGFGVIGIRPSLAAAVALSVILMIIRQIASFLRLVYQSVLTYLMTRRIRQTLFEQFLAARLSHQERVASGTFANTMTTESLNAAYAVIAPVDFVNGAMLMSAYLVLLLWLSPGATIVVIIVLAVVSFCLRGLLRRVRTLGREIVLANAAYAQHFLERCRSSRLIRLAHTEATEMKEATRLLRRQEAHNVNIAKAIALFNVGIEPLALIVGLPVLVIAVVFYGAPLVSVGMYFIVLARLAPIFRQLAGAWHAYLKLRASTDNVLASMDSLRKAREASSGIQKLDKTIRSITFEAVRFRHLDAQSDALDGINLRIPGGKMVAIVGPSGAGKSTLIDLIPQLRTPTRGRVLINDVPLEDYDLSSLRRACAYVSQTPIFLEGEIGEQIRYGAPAASDAAVRRAAEIANAHGFIKAIPGGYSARMGESGVGLSGGQRQRIELARALLAKASILILDEPTSSVDGESSAQIIQALENIRLENETTIIIVAHQLGTIKNCDVIFVIEDGKITGQGIHRTLVEQSGWYRTTFLQQADTAKTNTIEAIAVGQ